MGKRVAFLDVDMTLIDNKNSEYNEGLLRFLTENKFDQVYLVTGRNVNDLWQHVLQQGKKPEHWTKQLLCHVVEQLEQRGIPVTAISTPYDHYLAANPGPKIFSIEKAGDSALQFYLAFEKKIETLPLSSLTLSSLLSVFSKLTGGAQYVEDPFDPSSKVELALALPTYLAMTGDTEKRGQFEFLLERVLNENEGPLEVFFFDDKPENLATAQQLFKTNNKVMAYHTIEVDSVSQYTVPREILYPVVQNNSTQILATNGIFKVDSRAPTDDSQTEDTPKLQ